MTEPIQTPPTPPRKRRRFLRFAVGFCVLLTALVWFAPAIIARTSLRDRIIDSALVDLNGKVRAESASMSWFSPVELREVTFTEPSGRVAVKAPKLTTSKSLWQLATQRGDLGTFRIEDPTVIVSVENGSTNIEDWIANYTKADGTPPKPERLAFAIEATNGKVTCPGNPETHLQNASFAFVSPKDRTEPMEIRFAGETPAGGKINVAVRLGADNGVKLTASAFALETLEPLLPRLATGVALGGSLTAEFSAKWQTPADKPMTVEASGSASVDDFTLRAPLLKGETLTFKTVALLPSDIRTLESGAIEVKSLKILCDAGDASISGLFDPSADLDRLLKQPGVTASVHLDLAKLAKRLPQFLSIRDDTVITQGSVELSLKSEASPTGTLWVGDVQTRDIKAMRGQEPLVWKSPLQASFRGRLLEGGLPDLEEVKLLSEFLSIAARGQLGNFSAAARLDLRKLLVQLEQFVDLGDLKLTGEGVVRLSAKPVPGADSSDVSGSVDLTNLDIRYEGRTYFAEPELHAKFDALVKWLPQSTMLIDSSNFSFFTDAARPQADKLRGRGTLTGTVKMSSASYSGEKLIVDLREVRFVGAGLNVDEATLRLAANASYDRASKNIAITDVQLAATSVGASAAKLDLKPDDQGKYGVTGPVAVSFLLIDRLQKTLNFQTDPTGADCWQGTAKGAITLDANATKAGFEADMRIESFAYGTPSKPAWTEPWITVKGSGNYDFKPETLTLKPTKVARDGFSIDAEGSVGQLSTTMDLNLAGNLTYDLAKLDAKLKEFLGKSGQVSGQGTKPFALSGNLAGGGKNLAVRVGEPRPSNLDYLKGNAAVGWKTLKAYGFDVGEAELKANVGDGKVKINRVEALFGSGKVHVEPTLALNPGAYDLTFAKGNIIDRARLSPAACADAIGYALPAIANVAQAEGLFSFDLGDNRFPMIAPTKGTMAGVLLIHEAEVSPGPVVSQIADLLGSKPLKLQLTKDQRVPIEFRDGRVYHKDFAITVDGYTVKTSGSVGVDGSLALILEVPLSGKLAAQIVPADQPKLRDAVSKQSVKIAIGGTLAKPQIDRNAFNQLLANTLRNTAKEYAKDAAEDLILKGLQKFLPKK